jgi:SH3 domain protein
LSILKNKIRVFLFLISATFLVNANSIVYVTDQVDIHVRSEKDFGDNILFTLPSGTKLIKLNTSNDGWVQIKYNNTVGWIIETYLSKEPPIRNELIKLKAEFKLLKAQFTELKTQKIAIQTQIITEQEALKVKAKKTMAEVQLKAIETKIIELEAKAREAEAKAEVATKQKELAEEQAKVAQQLTQVELELKNQLEVEIAAKQQVYESEQYVQLLVQEIQEGQESDLLQEIKNQKAILQAAWVNNIAAKVKSVWRFPGAKPDWFVQVLVTQDKEGKVLNVNFEENNLGNSSNQADFLISDTLSLDDAFLNSVERAIYKSSPLPIAPDVSVFDKNIRFIFNAN